MNSVKDNSTVDIVRTLHEEFNPTGEILSITDNGDDTFDLIVCKLFNTRPKRTITIDDDDTEYTVLEVDVENKIITISSEDPVTGSEYHPPHVYFFHGTPLATAQELVNIKVAADKIPMLYVYEILKDERFPSRQSILDRKSSVTLYFMDQAEFNAWDTDKHYDLAIIPMARYAIAFMDDFLFYHKQLDQIEPYELTYHAKFNPQVSQNGVLKSLFSDQMSGVEVKVTLPIKKSFVCNCPDVNT